MVTEARGAGAAEDCRCILSFFPWGCISLSSLKSTFVCGCARALVGAVVKPQPLLGMQIFRGGM